MQIKKRALEKAFDQFNIKKVAQYNEFKISELLNNKTIICHEGKIRALIHNAKQIIRLQHNYRSFSIYLWQFSKNQILNYILVAISVSSLKTFSATRGSRVTPTDRLTQPASPSVKSFSLCIYVNPDKFSSEKIFKIPTSGGDIDLVNGR